MTSILDPAVPAGAYDQFLPQALRRARSQREWTPADGSLPALYLSHGAPPLFDDGVWLRQLFDWAQSLPKPRSVLIVSAHWETAPLCLSAPAANTPLVYDFGGFHPRYYTMRYPTPDASVLAHRIAAAMPDAEPVHQHPNRGLDHGAWVPAMLAWPAADIPIFQLSIQPQESPAHHLALGRKLAPLREEGVLVMGSGSATHNLRALVRGAQPAEPEPCAQAFDDWLAEAVAKGDEEALADYRGRAPYAREAHPTDEHFLPLHVAYGAAGEGARGKPLHRSFTLGNLSMASYAFA